LVEWSLPTPENLGSNPNIGKFNQERRKWRGWNQEWCTKVF